MLVLVQLGKTYWTADLQHKLFNESLKVLNGNNTTAEKEPSDTTRSQSEVQQFSAVNDPRTPDIPHNMESGIMPGSLEDFINSFNPFMGLPHPPDDLR